MGQSNSMPKAHAPYIRPLCSGSDGSPVLWTIRGNQSFLGLVSIGSFGLIARLAKKKRGLAVINPVELSQGLRNEIQELENETQCRVTTIYSPGDWHHLHLGEWSSAFADAKVYVASDRVIKKQPSLKDRATVLAQVEPVVPELSEEGFELVPFLGCKQPSWLLGGDKKGTDRVEQVVFHKPTKTLFITDHVFAPSTPGKSPSSNTGGFAILRADQAADSARKVMALEPQRILFSHGTEDTFLLQRDDTKDGTTAVEMLNQAYTGHFI